MGMAGNTGTGERQWKSQILDQPEGHEEPGPSSSTQKEWPEGILENRPRPAPLRASINTIRHLRPHKIDISQF